MTLETDAAILTKLVFEQNSEMKAPMNAAEGSKKDLGALVMPLFREMLSQLAATRQAYDRRATNFRQRVYPENGPTVEALLKIADRTIYEMERQEKSGGSAEPDSAR